MSGPAEDPKILINGLRLAMKNPDGKAARAVAAYFRAIERALTEHAAAIRELRAGRTKGTHCGDWQAANGRYTPRALVSHRGALWQPTRDTRVGEEPGVATCWRQVA